MAYIDKISVEAFRASVTTIFEYPEAKAIAGLIVASFNWLFGVDYETLTIVFVLIIFDTITGVLRAFHQNKLSSSEFFRFAIKFVVYSILIAVGRIIDRFFPVQFAARIVETFLIITEILSITENISLLGFPIPPKLLKLLKKLDVINSSEYERFKNKPLVKIKPGTKNPPKGK